MLDIRSNHWTIRKALKKPSSSFNRLLNELSSDKICSIIKKKLMRTKIMKLAIKRRFSYLNMWNLQQDLQQLALFKQAWLEKLLVEVKESKIKKNLKEELHFSYKRGCASVTFSKSKNSKQLQSMFSSRMLMALHKDKLIVNIDESWFNNFVRTHIDGFQLQN